MALERIQDKIEPIVDQLLELFASVNDQEAVSEILDGSPGICRILYEYHAHGPAPRMGGTDDSKQSGRPHHIQPWIAWTEGGEDIPARRP